MPRVEGALEAAREQHFGPRALTQARGDVHVSLIIF
jgi:hypothetical protein